LKKKLFFMALFAFFLYQIFILLNSEGEMRQVSESHKALPENFPNIATEKKSPDIQTNECNSSQVQLTSKNASVSINSFDEKLQKSKRQTLEDVEVTLARIKTDKDFQDSDFASIALFNQANQCFPLNPTNPVFFAEKLPNSIVSKNPRCAPLPLSIVRDRFKLIEEEAKKGSAYAKTVYVMNAFIYMQFYKALSTNDSVRYAEAIRVNAKKFGEEAAREGIEEANLAMSHAYLTGVFGQKDLSLAYAYLLPLSKKENSPGFTSGLQKMEMRLSNSEKEKAQKIAFGCNKNHKINTINPFQNKIE